MENSALYISWAVTVGIGATAVMDAWLMLLNKAGIKTLDFAMVGRWAGHLLRGRLVHAGIGKSSPVRGERALGWALHYLTGIVFASVLLAFTGAGWLAQPTLLPALATGVITVLVPFCVIQPCMGAGFASANTPAPMKTRALSLTHHAVFGMGLFLSALGIACVA